MHGEAVEFIDGAFEVEIKQGIAILTRPNGQRRAIPLAIFRQDHARATKALAEFDARSGVVPIRANG